MTKLELQIALKEANELSQKQDYSIKELQSTNASLVKQLKEADIELEKKRTDYGKNEELAEQLKQTQQSVTFYRDQYTNTTNRLNSLSYQYNALLKTLQGISDTHIELYERIVKE